MPAKNLRRFIVFAMPTIIAHNEDAALPGLKSFRALAAFSSNQILQSNDKPDAPFFRALCERMGGIEPSTKEALSF
jgi:hypothetical protein